MFEWFVKSSGFGKIRLPRIIWIILLLIDVAIIDPLFLIDELILLAFSVTPT